MTDLRSALAAPRPKVSVPRRIDRAVERPRLLRDLTGTQFDDPAATPHPDLGAGPVVLLACAPAGYGKTTMLADWTDQQRAAGVPVAWVTCDRDDDGTAFWSAVILAATEAAPDSATVLAGLDAPAGPADSTFVANLMDVLGDEVPGAPPRARRRARGAHPRGARRHPAPGRVGRRSGAGGARLPLRTADRAAPAAPHRAPARGARGPAGLHRRGGRRLLDLRFSPTEIAAFVERTLGAPLAEDALAVLAEKTEGWAAALRLATLTLRHSGDAESQIAGLYAENRYLMDYLVREVLSSLPPHIQSFLLKTAILDRLSGPLCDAITRQDDSVWSGQQYLEWLVGANVFTMSLDSQGQWFRYHHLFQTLLLDQLKQRHSAQEIVALHAGASAWYASNGFVVEAISHALAAGDEDAAVKVVQAHRHQAMNEERWQQLEHWLRLMPQRLVDQRPELLLLRAWMLQVRWQFAALPPYLDRIEALLEQHPVPEPELTGLRSEIDALRSMHYHLALDAERTATHAARALQTAPMAYSFVRSQAWLYHAGSLALVGDIRVHTTHSIRVSRKTGSGAAPVNAHSFIGRTASRRGARSTQFSHLIDVATTVLDAAGIPEPAFVNGRQQMPLQGHSMVPSFHDAGVPEFRETQYFEMLGNRGIYHQGWTACTIHGVSWVMTGKFPRSTTTCGSCTAPTTDAGPRPGEGDAREAARAAAPVPDRGGPVQRAADRRPQGGAVQCRDRGSSRS